MNISNRYFQVPFEVLLFKGFVCAALIAVVLAVKAYKDGDTADRILYAPILAFSLYMLFARTAYETYLGGVMVSSLRLWLLVVCAVLLLAYVLDRHTWVRLKIASAVSIGLFVFSQPALAQFLAKDVVWPPRGAMVQPAQDEAIVFLLLDELSSSSRQPIVDALKEVRLEVSEKMVDSVGDRTVKVIPEMFSGQRFTNSKPCAGTAVCSGSNVLDFSRITASRPDIDVIGFYHPYCAINGLRSCFHLMQSENERYENLRCLMRHPEELYVNVRTYCKQHLKLLSKYNAAIGHAPIWRQGGLMYVHVPLPHPRDDTDGGTLRDDYARNLGWAGEMVADLVAHARRSGISKFRLVIFSDHPFRPKLWCKQEAYRNRAGCDNQKEIYNEKVPMIVSGYGMPLPDLSNMITNQAVFDLAR